MRPASNQAESAPREFDLASEEDARELKSWCRIHWQHTLCKGIKSCNTPIYHDCCISFTKRGCIKRLSHPALQSASVLKIPSLRNTESPEELYEWLRGRLLVQYKMGKKLYFPSINTAHFTSEEDEGDEDSKEQEELLGKRLYQLTELKFKAEEEVKNLKEENSKLLNSSKCWFAKYQELLSRQDEDVPSYSQITPKKLFTSKETLTNEDLLNF
jgi:hypothetical protein